MASLTAPAIVALSGDMGLVVPLVSAHLFCFYFGILADDTPPVGLAAYAAAAIAKEDPIKVGVQGFKYDMRTALLPFMFIFNTELLLVGVDTIPFAIWVFATTLVAMFAFSSAIQGYLVSKNKRYESLILALCALILFRPALANSLIDIGRTEWKFAGIFLYFLVFGMQWMRRPKVS